MRCSRSMLLSREYSWLVISRHGNCKCSDHKFEYAHIGLHHKEHSRHVHTLSVERWRPGNSRGQGFSNSRELAHGRKLVLQQSISLSSSSTDRKQTQATFVLHRLLGHPCDCPEPPSAALAAIMPMLWHVHDKAMQPQPFCAAGQALNKAQGSKSPILVQTRAQTVQKNCQLQEPLHTLPCIMPASLPA